jgi:membrane protein required for beta-lactamase induction
MTTLVFFLEETSAAAMLDGRRYQKVSGSREIGKYLDANRNNSHSFNVFALSLTQILGNKQPERLT